MVEHPVETRLMGEGTPLIVGASSVMDDESRPAQTGAFEDLSGESITIADRLDPETLLALRRLR